MNTITFVTKQCIVVVILLAVRTAIFILLTVNSCIVIVYNVNLLAKLATCRSQMQIIKDCNMSYCYVTFEEVRHMLHFLFVYYTMH